SRAFCRRWSRARIGAVTGSVTSLSGAGAATGAEGRSAQALVRPKRTLIDARATRARRGLDMEGLSSAGGPGTSTGLLLPLRWRLAAVGGARRRTGGPSLPGQYPP